MVKSTYVCWLQEKLEKEKIHGKFYIKAMMMADGNESVANYLTPQAMEKYNIK